MSRETKGDLEAIPYFTVLSGVLFLFNVIFAFSWTMLPVYACEVLMFLIIGLELTENQERKAAGLGFLSIMVWFAAQITLLIAGLNNTTSTYLWLFALVQFAVAFMYFQDPKQRMNFGMDALGKDVLYAGLFMIGCMAFVGIVEAISYLQPLSALLWPSGVLMITLGYLVPRIEPEKVDFAYLKILGLLLCVWVAVSTNRVLFTIV